MREHEDALFNYINSISPVSRDWFEELYKLIVFRNYSKEEIFIQRNEADPYEYFLIEGVCRSYLLNVEEADVTVSLFQGPRALPPNSVRTVNGLSMFNYQALTDLTMGCIETKSYVNLMMHISEIRGFRNALLHQELIQMVGKEVSLISLPAIERIQKFRAAYPTMEELIPKRIIASYLGINDSNPDKLFNDISTKQ